MWDGRRLTETTYQAANQDPSLNEWVLTHRRGCFNTANRPALNVASRCALGQAPSSRPPKYACRSRKDRPNVIGAIRGDWDRSGEGILDAHPIGFRTRNV